MIEQIDEILEKMTIEEKAALVCGASSFTTNGVPSLGIDGLQVLDGGTGINYEQLFGDLIRSWSRNSETAEERELFASITMTENKNIYKNYFRPDKLSEKEKAVWKRVKEHLNRVFLKNTRNSETALAYHYSNHEDEDLLSPGCFPAGMMLGATFNPDVVSMVGHALGREARAYGVELLLGTPNINILRDPLNGRLFEGYSEDPRLIERLAPELVKGVQAEGVAANIKHFAANNQEKNRQGIDETISERTLHEIYFPGFLACVKQGHPASVMSAYNKINGTACTENRWLLESILRNYWGFDGMVLSDWGAVYNEIAALKAGNDLNMPGPVNPEAVLQAVEDGELAEEELTINAKRVLEVICTYGKPPRYEESCQYIMDMSKQAAYRAAAEGIVLLKNENGIFPLNVSDDGAGDSVFNRAVETEGAKVVLCGSGAVKLFDCGTGSAGITTDRTSSIYNGLVDNGVNVSIGIPASDKKYEIETYICVARIMGMEGNDRSSMCLAAEDINILNQMVEIKRENPGCKLGLILNVSGPVELSPWERFLDGIFVMFLPGMEGGHAMADILTGRVNPSGKLPVTFPKKYLDTPTCLNFPGDGMHVTYGEGIYVGYRYYEKKQIEPMYPFGHGLSYSTFSISNMRVSAETKPVPLVYPDGEVITKPMPVFTDTIKISVDIENVGPEKFGAGKEVLQLYVSDAVSHLTKPVKELKAFKKVSLDYGEKRKVLFELEYSDFASYDEELHNWTVEEGIYCISIGTSSKKIMCSMDVYLDTISPYSYHENSSIKELYENTIIRDHMKKLLDRLSIDYGYILGMYEYVPRTTLAKIIKNKKPQGLSLEEENALEEFKSILSKIKKI